ncbi:MAG: hypothetical protein LBR07_02890 [Puniceicoccales bacterium]|jgi:hypothetical protein|nr:hypothetical protein [Puniceicoccales bacterium]
MKLVIDKIIPREICHFADDSLLVTSCANKVFAEHADGRENVSFSVPYPKWWQRLGALFRLTRRALRLDKMNVAPVAGGFCILHQGKIWRYDNATRTLTQTGQLSNCRNVLHQSICVLDGGNTLYFGEYGANRARAAVPVWHSSDAGKTWTKIFSFPAKKIKHIHGCFYDPFEDKIWTITGDFENECWLLCSDREFKNLEWVGTGQQEFRACNLFFTHDAIHWVMDSQLQDSHHVQLDRKTRTVQEKTAFPGPGWYHKKLEDGFFLVSTAVEIGPGVHEKNAHVFVTRDFEKWESAAAFPHDGLPLRYFKFGVIAFADGAQSSNKFYLFGEALKGIEGKIALCHLEPTATGGGGQ